MIIMHLAFPFFTISSTGKVSFILWTYLINYIEYSEEECFCQEKNGYLAVFPHTNVC